MCGIAGYMQRDGKAVPDGLVPAMCDTIRHRGPDDDGYFADTGVVLGMRRLSIIDVDGGRQPIPNENGTVWVVFNGEIYNFRHLRRTLQAQGHRFETSSDTETIVHAYEQYGLDFVHHLVGMFAIALWDCRLRRLVLVRDRLGKKPIYLVERGASLAFASEIKALLPSGLVDHDLDLDALDEYLTFGYIGGERSIFRNVRKLPPAHILVATAQGVEVRRYWTLEAHEDRVTTRAELVTRIRAVLEDAVRCRLESDVPLGAFLSGGIDSATVVGLASQMVPGRLRTFSIGFDEVDFDELQYARITAQRFGTEHHELVVHPNLLDCLPALVAAFDEPFADPSMVPTYFVSRLAREHVTVAITGDGGDELFGGYRRYQRALASRPPESWPAPVRGVVSRLARRLSLDVRGRQRLAALAFTDAARYTYRLAVFPLDRRARLYSPELRRAIDRPAEHRLLDAFEATAAEPLLARMQQADIMTYLPDDILVKVDRVSMQCSLECRAPLLDHRLAELAATIPAELRVDGATGKVMLREAAADLLPPELLTRPKTGFDTPLVHWLRGPAGAPILDLLLDGSLARRGYFKPAAIRQLVAEHRAHLANHAARLWALAILEQWHRQLADRPVASGSIQARNLRSSIERPARTYAVPGHR